MLTDESTGARTARVTAVERTGPEDPGTPASRDNDRLVVVTEGKLTAEIAARPGRRPGPGGDRHPGWCAAPHLELIATPVRYLDADVPAPDAYAKLAPAQ